MGYMRAIWGLCQGLFLRLLVGAPFSAFLVVFFIAPHAAAAGTVGNYPAPGLMVRVGDHRLHLDCVGTGGPSVVMESGLGGNSLDWSRVQPQVAGFARVCTYDRAGYGWSETGPLPRTSGRIASELHTLLHKAGVQTPYVLVGHSFGGYNVRLFASYYPDEVAGLVLVDVAHEDQFRRLQQHGILPRIGGARMSVTASVPAVPENLPRDVRPVARALVATFNAQYALRGEMVSFRDSAQEVREAGALPDVPVLVITRGKRVWPHTERGERLEAIWADLQDDLANRFACHNDGAERIHLYAKHSGHYVQLDEPGVVVGAIRQVVDSSREELTPRSTWIYANNP
jgi:pimeloyl-ACP methyl ester carboxylesterase